MHCSVLVETFTLQVFTEVYRCLLKALVDPLKYPVTLAPVTALKAAVIIQHMNVNRMTTPTEKKRILEHSHIFYKTNRKRYPVSLYTLCTSAVADVLVSVSRDI